MSPIWCLIWWRCCHVDCWGNLNRSLIRKLLNSQSMHNTWGIDGNKKSNISLCIFGNTFPTHSSSRSTAIKIKFFWFDAWENYRCCQVEANLIGVDNKLIRKLPKRKFVDNFNNWKQKTVFTGFLQKKVWKYFLLNIALYLNKLVSQFSRLLKRVYFNQNEDGVFLSERWKV